MIAARGRALLLALLVGLLTACTVAPLRATSEVGPDQGVVVIRVVVRTRPQEQWRVERELRQRIKTALDAAGIALPAV